LPEAEQKCSSGQRLVQRWYPAASLSKCRHRHYCASALFVSRKTGYPVSGKSRLRPGEIVAKQLEKAKLPFDPTVFLKTEGDGRTIAKYRRNQQIFSQDSASDSIFYVIKGKVKIIVLSEQG
jgi:hypothetical protein